MFSFTWHSRASVFHLISFLHWHLFLPLSNCLNMLKLGPIWICWKYQISSFPPNPKCQITYSQTKLMSTTLQSWARLHLLPSALPSSLCPTWAKHVHIWLLRTWYDICAHVIRVPWFPTSCEACIFQQRPHFFLWPGLHSQKPHLWDENLRLSCTFLSYWQWDRGGQPW